MVVSNDGLGIFCQWCHWFSTWVGITGTFSRSKCLSMCSAILYGSNRGKSAAVIPCHFFCCSFVWMRNPIAKKNTAAARLFFFIGFCVIPSVSFTPPNSNPNRVNSAWKHVSRPVPHRRDKANGVQHLLKFGPSVR